jgi:hypothetical protein
MDVAYVLRNDGVCPLLELAQLSKVTGGEMAN